MIPYKKTFDLLKEKGVSMYKIINDNVITPSSLQRMRLGTSPTNRGIDGRTIDPLCKYLNCQRGDLMEYVTDEDEEQKENQSSSADSLGGKAPML